MLPPLRVLVVASAAAVLVGGQYNETQLWSCDSTSPNQIWTSETSAPYPFAHIFLSRSFNVTSRIALVLDIDDFSNKTGATVWTYPNTTGLHGYNEQWDFSGDGPIVSKMNGLCLTASYAVAGSSVVLQNCSDAPLQLWTINSTTGLIANGGGQGLCLDAGTTVSCSSPPLSNYLYCDPSASTEARLADLVPRIQPAEFPRFLSNSNNGIVRLGVPQIGFSECLHGPLTSCGAPYTDNATGYTSTGCPTSFPHLLLQASSFNRSLWSLIGAAIGDEDRGLHNQKHAGSMFWAPDINEFRDPRWGRGQEVPGEDPTLTSEFAYRYVSALQGGPDDRYKKIVSTCKHFSAYDLENSDNVTRYNFNAQVSQKDLVEYYWPAFRSCVQRAHVGSIMCSYNAVNGVPSCANGPFQNGVVREQWGWDGFFVSDCGAISDIFESHNYTDSWNATMRAAIHDGGTDVACDSAYPSYILAAYQNGSISLADLQAAATNFLRQAFELGLMDPPDQVPYNSYGAERVDTAAHRQLAYEAALQGIVLLQNNASSTSPNGAGTPSLPLQHARLSGKKVAVIGPNANATQTLLSNYHGTNTVVSNHSILAALQSAASSDGFSVSYAPGCLDGPTGNPLTNVSIACATPSGFADAVAAAQGAAVAVVVVGLCADNCPSPADHAVHESEGRDRAFISLPGQQEALVQAIAATGTSVVVVLVHGGALAIEWTQANIPAIIDAHYPGELGGDAVVSILFGYVSPSGREVTTTYPASFVTARNMTDMQLEPHTVGSTPVPGITYLYYEGPTLWPFGWGLSFTTFAYAWFDDAAAHQAVDAAAWAAGTVAPPAYAVNVTNTGTVKSDVVALAFYSTGLPGEPVEELFDFARASDLAPGASVTLYFTLPPLVAATVSASGEQALTPGTFKVRIGDVPGPHAGNVGGESGARWVDGRLDIIGAQPVPIK